MPSGSSPQSTGSPKSSPSKATPTRSGPDAPAPSESWPNPLRRCGYSSNTNTSLPSRLKATSPVKPPSQRTPASQTDPLSQQSAPSQANPQTPKTSTPCPNPKPNRQNPSQPPMIISHYQRPRRRALTLKRHDPRAVLHFHLAEAALRTGHAIVRPGERQPAHPQPARGVPSTQRMPDPHPTSARSHRGSTSRRL